MFLPPPIPFKNISKTKTILTPFQEIIKEATEMGDPVAGRIKQLKLEINHIVMLLQDPYAHLGKETLFFGPFVFIF